MTFTVYLTVVHNTGPQNKNKNLMYLNKLIPGPGIRGYGHHSCNVLSNAMVKHNSPTDNTSQPLVMTLESSSGYVTMDTTQVVSVDSTAWVQ